MLVYSRRTASIVRLNLLIGKIMKFPNWMKPALLGAGLGAIVCAIGGFGWGGWTTSSAAAEKSRVASNLAVATALVPYCIAKSKSDPKLDEITVKLKSASLYQRNRIIEEAGWATPLGANSSSSALADACQEQISKTL